MKFKLFFYLSALFVGASCCLTSCEESTGEDADVSASIFWNKSDAFHMYLKGKVKTVKEISGDNTNEYSFNESGNLVSEKHKENGVVFLYSNGRLTKEIITWFLNKEHPSDTISYTYANFGKYIPQSKYVEYGLLWNIARIRTTHLTGYTIARFVPSGDSILMIYTFYEGSSNPRLVKSDTTSVAFNGSIYPATMRRPGKVITMTYALNGRFETIEEVEQLDKDRQVITHKTFQSDNEYMLPISKVAFYPNEDRTSTDTYTFNQNDDLIGIYHENYYEECFDYQYDSMGNWISRKFRYGFESYEPAEIVTITRQITYWE